MDKAIRHFKDSDHVFTGHDGEWTVCGRPWEAQDLSAEHCRECVDAVVDYADRQMRAGSR